MTTAHAAPATTDHAPPLRADPLPRFPSPPSRTMAGQLCEDHGVSLYRLACLLTGDRNEARDLVAKVITDRSTWTNCVRHDNHEVRAELARMVYHDSRAPSSKTMSPPLRGRTANGPAATSALPSAMTWLGTVSAQQRDVIALYLFGGCTRQDAADVLGLSASRVAALLNSALHELTTGHPETQID